MSEGRLELPVTNIGFSVESVFKIPFSFSDVIPNARFSSVS